MLAPKKQNRSVAKKMKNEFKMLRVIILVLILVAAQATSQAGAQAANQTTAQAAGAQPVPISLWLTSAAAPVNQDLKVSLNIAGNSNLSAATFEISYDASRLEVFGAIKGAILTTGVADVVVDNTKGTVKFVYINMDGFNGAGSILDVTFRIKDAASGVIPLNLFVTEFLDNNYDEIAKTVSDGSITVLVPTATPTASPAATTAATATATATPAPAAAPTAATATATPAPAPTPTTTPTHILIPITNVNISKSTATINTNQTLQLTVTILPSNATNKAVKWSSENTKIATVSSNGKVTAKLPGTTTITVMSKNGSFKAACKITVRQPLISINLNKTKITLAIGKSYKLVSTINPSNASNKRVLWKTSNSKTATINSSGAVLAKAKGTAYITVTSEDGKKSARCTVTVK